MWQLQVNLSAEQLPAFSQLPVDILWMWQLFRQRESNALSDLLRIRQQKAHAEHVSRLLKR